MTDVAKVEALAIEALRQVRMSHFVGGGTMIGQNKKVTPAVVAERKARYAAFCEAVAALTGERQPAVESRIARTLDAQEV